MRFSPQKKSKKLLLGLMITLFIIYIVFSLFTLTHFPFVHSDEAWLSGLSRNILEQGDFSVTETFFDLKPRYPHAIKSIFHGIQLIFLQVFGYQIWSFRLISFLFGLSCLWMTYQVAWKLTKSPFLSLGAALLLAFDIQFFYASHFARQEIILLFFLLTAFSLYRSHVKQTYLWKPIAIGMLLGLSIGIHPNSFVISLPFLLLYSYDIFFTKKIPFSHGLLCGGIIAIFAIGFVLLSFSFDREFIRHYLLYGSEFDVDAPLKSKLSSLLPFYQKLFYRVSGTYFTPDIRFQFFFFPVTAVFALLAAFREGLRKSDLPYPLIVVLGLNLGMILIGRYNATSVIFQFPFYYLMLIMLLAALRPVLQSLLLFLTIGILSLITILTVNFSSTDYQAYLKEIGRVLSPQSIVLANLNAEYYFDNGRLFDYRNLAFLEKNDLSFGEYIRKNQVEYIILPEEMFYIYENRPKWNGLYGNPYYYPQMMDFIDNSCEKVHEFENGSYGMRIVRYMNTKPWRVVIYKVKR